MKNEIIRNWLRNRNTNDNFKSVEFDRFRKKVGLNSFALSIKQWQLSR